MSENKVGTISSGYYGDTRASIKALNNIARIHSNKLNTLVSLLWGDNEAKQGGVLSGADARYTWQPDLSSKSVSALLSGIDGTSLYAYSKPGLESGVPSYRTTHPIFYRVNPENQDQSRPNTIYETFLAVIAYVDSSIAGAVTNTITVTGDTISNSTKSYIGMGAWGGTSATGSMDGKITTNSNRNRNLATAVFGNLYNYPDPEPCSLNDKVNALLALHGGAFYTDSYTTEGSCTIGLLPDSEVLGCPARQVDTFDVSRGMHFKIDNTGAIVSGGMEYKSFKLPETNLYAYFNNMLIDPTEGDLPTYIELDPNLLDLYDFGENGEPYVQVSKWTWNLNSRFYNLEDTSTSELPENVLVLRNKVSMDTKFNICLGLDWLPPTGELETFKGDPVVAASSPVLDGGLTSGFGGYIEVALHCEDSTAPVAIYKFPMKPSLVEDLETIGYVGSGETWELNWNANKYVLAYDICLRDFTWLVGSADDYIDDMDGFYRHNIAYASITMATTPAAGITLRYQAAVAEELEDPMALIRSEGGMPRFVMLEFSYIDDCGATIAPPGPGPDPGMISMGMYGSGDPVEGELSMDAALPKTLVLNMDDYEYTINTGGE